MDSNEGRIDDESELSSEPLDCEAERGYDGGGEVEHLNQFSNWLESGYSTLENIEHVSYSLKQLSRENCESDSLSSQTKVKYKDLSPRDEEDEYNPQTDIEGVPLEWIVEEVSLEVNSSGASSE